jgi:hypothetical protein
VRRPQRTGLEHHVGLVDWHEHHLGHVVATPHVAGAAALHLDIPGDDRDQAVRDALVAQGSAVVSLSSRAKRAGTTNRLLYTRFMLDS